MCAPICLYMHMHMHMCMYMCMCMCAPPRGSVRETGSSEEGGGAHAHVLGCLLGLEG